jgi:hypothetical protein
MKLFVAAAAMAAMSAVSAADLRPRPLTGELIHAPCFIRASGSLEGEYKSCVAEFEKNNKPTTFALLTADGDVYVLVQVNGMRTIMVGSMKKTR